MKRRGFALLAVLWVVAALGSAVAVTAGALRTAERASRNRILLARARWAAEACGAIAQASWATDAPARHGTAGLGRGALCTWRMEDTGLRLNVNVATGDALARVFAARRVPADSAARWVSRLVQLRRARPFGTPQEALAASRIPGEWEQYLTTFGSGGVSAGAPSAVLASVEGLTPEALWLLNGRNAAGRPVANLEELESLLSPTSRTVLRDHYAGLAATLRFTPTEYLLTLEGWVAIQDAAPRATILLLVAPQPERLAILKRVVS